MRIIVRDEPVDVAAAAAHQVVATFQARPSGVVGLATGSSPRPLYAALAAAIDRGDLDLSRVRAFALDEYVGLAETHPQSYHAVVHRDATVPLHLDPTRVQVPRGTGPLDDVDRAATAFDQALMAAGPVDLQILGIGINGHVGFNEPGSDPSARTRRVALAPATMTANSRFFGSREAVPRQAVSQGIATILDARQLILIATGDEKAAAVRRAVEGPTTADHPASLLRDHPGFTLYVDRSAASLLPLEMRRRACGPTSLRSTAAGSSTAR